MVSLHSHDCVFVPIGRRVAELELHVALAHFMRNFRLEYSGTEPIGFTQKLFVVPDRQLDLTFVDL